ncbi:uncharacterized protein LOC133524913 [Cydia pomonella]|uniref:uncharacterized protein LOC133524913 n=1 Tax=Cydia pomonella TaxID=82600 RepID=UPI002ADDD9C0|nr:uncharacterized protein LOC133524913 [Cydia pomonella]
MPSSSSSIKCNFVTVNSGNALSTVDDDLQNQLARFWQLEEVSHQSSQYSHEEKLCEEHFQANTVRLKDGSFCVRLPLKQSPKLLGESFQRAKHCFLSLERRWKNRPSFRKLYIEFMSEYHALGHMSEYVPTDSGTGTYFIPHHGILRDSTTTKLRTVFNASSPTTSGVSLNDLQMIGPTVQDDLLSILIRFRQHKYVISADIEKMYRTVFLHPDDRKLQLILWRENESDALKTYQLNTVSYGTASAAFLACRCLKQIGLDCQDKPLSEIIIHDFYVDDLLTGGDDFDEVIRLRQGVTDALAAARMHLRKWKSNDPRLIDSFSPESKNLNMGTSESGKILGLGWHPDADQLYFPIGISVPKGTTKRDILSTIAQIFDPLGLLSPCVITMKILMQRLWLHRLSWNQELPPETLKQWADIVSSLPLLNTIRIPRRVLCDSYESLELHIFTDSSERAYGACVYARSINDAGEVFVRLLIAKSRVCPLKPLTIPKLELCGALVGARLYQKVINSLRAQVSSATFWSDSTIVLAWLKTLPSKLQPFVRNRTAEILEISGNSSWRHVPTNENPADHVSRGVSFEEMNSLDLWWSGPSFLKRDASTWPQNPCTEVYNLPEVRTEITLSACIQDETFIDFERFSNFLRLKRAVAYVLRFISACKGMAVTTQYLNDVELKNALNLLIKISQAESLPEYKLLLKSQTLPKGSPLLKLNPFLDENSIMRVGGRLANSEFPYEQKHPIILQSTHKFTKLLFYFEHKHLLHAPPQLLLATIKERYWPIGGRNLAKLCYRQCVLCIRMKGRVLSPLMGNLPKTRLSPEGHVFVNVGVDYAGPINSASRQGRGCRIVKVYIAIFICFTTKAIHLELVGDLTSNNYLMALNRFMSRRGKPANIYSDNGTSFVGAYNELSRFLKSNCNSIAESASNVETNFHFLPAYAPHFGGLWEAGVKSTKHHLNRVLGNSNLTYEQLNTTLVRIEAILNSRPLTALSTEPDDLMPLTPGHFLIGRPLTALPAPDYRNHSYNYLTRFQRVEQLRQHFWTRWSKEYISDLQQRVKWQTAGDSLSQNTLVLLKEDNLPPLKWRLGRIVAVFPGRDGINRVADVRTANGVVRRAFSKICPLLNADVPT